MEDRIVQRLHARIMAHEQSGSTSGGELYFGGVADYGLRTWC